MHAQRSEVSGAGSNCFFAFHFSLARYNLPGDQGGFGVRDSRDNGRTVDVNIPGVPDVTKIHER